MQSSSSCTLALSLARSPIGPSRDGMVTLCNFDGSYDDGFEQLSAFSTSKRGSFLRQRFYPTDSRLVSNDLTCASTCPSCPSPEHGNPAAAALSFGRCGTGPPE
ncbi:unnamed protein product [Durusdinium trenchii]|uniref:Uncharacterized protein n=2 Tax=Durusdinium trenchii TaxID=1381693 RepID=A0ABP0MAN0_9DINO